MKILVAVKRVTDPEVKVKVKPDGSGIVTEGMNFVVNPFDEIAVEEGLRLKEKHEGEVVLMCIGPKESTQQIRSGLAMGADRGILVSGDDEELDSDAVAHIFKALVERENPDLVLLGKQAVDGDSNQVGQLLAEYLGWGQATFASKIEIGEGGKTAAVTREVDGGLETVEIDLPGVVTADLRLNEPRYASLPGIMKAKKKPLEELTVEDLGVSFTQKVKVLKLTPPPARQGGGKVESVEELMDKLRNEAKVL